MRINNNLTAAKSLCDCVTSDNFMYYYYLEYFMFIINQGQIHNLPYIIYIFKVMFYLMLSVYMLQVRASEAASN